MLFRLTVNVIATTKMLPRNWTNAAAAFVATNVHSNRSNFGLLCAAPELLCFFISFPESIDERDDATARRKKDSDVVAETASTALSVVRTDPDLDRAFLHCHADDV
jgi:hypothetical protein